MMVAVTSRAATSITGIKVLLMLAVVSYCCALQAVGLTSAKAPIILNLKRVMVNETGIIKLPKGEMRTKSHFFQQTLGIEAGKPFIFDIDKWKAIQRSGLFKNLTAKAEAVGTSEVVLKISGDELPSIRFSPEVSVAASITRPEVSGGLSFTDRNFRGLGQRFDFLITKKEGKEIGTDDLHPTIVVKWCDNKIGKSSSISVGYEEESRFEDGADIVPVMRLDRLLALGNKTRSRFATKIRKTFVKFTEKNHQSKQRESNTVSPLACKVELEIEPYRTLIGDDVSVSTLQGAKISADWNSKNKFSAKATHDSGVGIFSWGTAPYRQISGEINSPLIKVLKAFEGTIKSSVTSAEEGILPLSPLIEEDDNEVSPLQLMMKLKTSMMSSWGGACLPLFHKIPLGDSLTVRSYSDIPDDGFSDILGNHKKRASSFAAVKADFYLEGFSNFIPGFFIDGAVFRNMGISEENVPISLTDKALGAGLSVRVLGFRIDAAWPLLQERRNPIGSTQKDGDVIEYDRAAPRIHLGVDIGA